MDDPAKSAPTSAASRMSVPEIEDHVIAIESAVLFLGFAMDAVFVTPQEPENGWFVYRLNSDQVKSLSHAHGATLSAMVDLRRAFYGPDEGRP